MTKIDFFKKSVTSLLLYSGFVGLYRKLFPNKDPLILMYHKLKKNEFEKQIKYLVSFYNIISLEEFLDFLEKNKPFKKNTVVITFDDGYLNNYNEVLPILKKFNLPATLFITTGLIGKRELAWWDQIRYIIDTTNIMNFKFEFDNLILNFNLKTKKDKIEAVNILHKVMSKYDYNKRISSIKKLKQTLKTDIKDFDLNEFLFMSWSQVTDFKNSGVEIGSHTVTHPFLSNISPNEIKKELKDSKLQIEKKIGTKVKSFCYPSGNFDQGVKTLVKKAGYRCACSIKLGFIDKESNLYELKRVGVNINDNLGIFSLKVTKLWTIIRSKLIQNEY